MLYESAESMARLEYMHPSRVVKALNDLRPQCPVQLQTLRFKPWHGPQTPTLRRVEQVSGRTDRKKDLLKAIQPLSVRKREREQRCACVCLIFVRRRWKLKLGSPIEYRRILIDSCFERSLACGACACDDVMLPSSLPSPACSNSFGGRCARRYEFYFEQPAIFIVGDQLRKPHDVETSIRDHPLERHSLHPIPYHPHRSN